MGEVTTTATKTHHHAFCHVVVITRLTNIEGEESEWIW
jgi:hypothetical protein